MLQGAQKALGLLEYNVQCEASVCRLLTWCVLWEKSQTWGKPWIPPRGCGVHGAEPGQIVWWAMHVAALQEKQTWTASWQNKVADAHENATRQTVSL